MAQGFRQLGSVSYAKNALAMFCTWARIEQLNPELFKIFQQEIHVCSSEPLETAHSRAAAGRASAHTFRFKEVRQIWVNITGEMQRSVGLERGYRCAVLAMRSAGCSARQCMMRRLCLTRLAHACCRVRGRGKARRYSGRVKVDVNHPLVAKAKGALLSLISECR